MTGSRSTPPSQGNAQRVGSGLGKRRNWEQLAKFCVVGASGYLVNLAVYASLLKGAGVHYLPAAVASFLVGSVILKLYPVKETEEELAMETPASTIPAGLPA